MLAIVALVISSFVKSPSQQAADVAAPTPSVLTAPVVQKVLAQSVVTRGTVESSGNLSITGKLGRDGGVAIVTKVKIAVGKPVPNGGLLIEVSGRPIFAFAGAVPAYRDITVGTSGDDVGQLRKDLMRLHILATGGGNTFSASDAGALARFYSSRHYKVAKDSSSRPMLPLSEFVFVPTIPATVAAVNGSVGDDLSTSQQPVVVLSTGRFSVTATIPSGSEAGIAAGQQVALDDEVNSKSAEGTVASVGAFTTGTNSSSGTGTNAQDGSGSAGAPGFPIVVRPKDPLSSDWLGANVRLTITLQSASAPQLVVPVTAISTSADGTTSVSVVGDDRAQTVVPVHVGQLSAGYAAIVGDAPGALKAGDLVVVG